MLVLAGLRRPIDVEELGSIEADALGAVVDREDRLGGQLDVRLQRDGNAVRGDTRLVARGEQAPRECEVLLRARSRVPDRLLRRVDGDETGEAVDDEHVAGADLRERIGDADHGRDLERARHDRRVARARADARDEGEGRLADGVLGGVADERTEESIASELDVVSALEDVRVAPHRLGGPEHRDDLLARLGDGPLRALLVVSDPFLDALVERRIREHHLVRLEDRRCVVHRLRHPHADFAERLLGVVHRLLHAVELLLGLRARDVAADERRSQIAEDERRTDGDTRRAGDPLE